MEELPTPTPYRALILLFRENAIPMSDRNSFLWTLIEEGLARAGKPQDPRAKEQEEGLKKPMRPMY